MTTTLKPCPCGKSFNANNTASPDMCDSCNDKILSKDAKRKMLSRLKAGK